MAVGDTHTIQAPNASGQSIKGLVWTSSDPTIVSLSAGGASADVTVSPNLAPGTILWSNPGDGSGVNKIVPAVPSSTGVADVFAFQNDGTVQAITSDGTTAWTAQASGGIPDFQGGLIVSKFDFNTDSFSIQKLDGLTGQPYPAYSSAIPASAVYPDGAVLIADTTSSGTVIGIDPISGTQKFAVTVNAFDAFFLGGQPIIAGDGYAYVPHADQAPGSCCVPVTLKMLRVNSSGAYDDIPIYSFITIPEVAVSIYTITNADEGVLVSWNTCETSGPSNPCQSVSRMAMLTGTSVSGLNPPQMPGQSQPIIPVLQAQDGSYIGTAGNAMIAFDQTGNLRWSVAGDWQPQIATADGGLIATLLDDNTGNPIGTYTFDQNGSATGQTGSLPTYSWKGAYQIGSIESLLPFFDMAFIAQSHAAVPRGNLTGNGLSLVHHTFGLVFCGAEGDGACSSSKYLFNTTPTSSSYLPVSSLNDQTYNAQPPTGPADFSGAHPDWVQTIRKKANDAYRAAFALLPAIVSQGWKANPVSPAQGFEHTVYVSGNWHLGGDFALKGEPTGQTQGVGNCSDTGICFTSNVWYLDIMGYAQQALQFLPPGGKAPLSPTYPPSDPTAAAQFVQVTTAIGIGIGNIAAHETGHQLGLPQMDCSNGVNSACTEDYIYQNGNSSGLANEWFYGAAPGEKIHWSSDALCTIYKFLGMKNTGCRN